MYPDDKIHQIIISLFSGNTSPEDRKILDVWLDENPENRKIFNDLKEIWLKTGTIKNSDQYHLEEAILNFKNRIQNEKGKRVREIFRIPLVRYAAVFILLLALPFSYYIGRVANNSETCQTIITCGNGDRTNVTLPDGTKVWLNSGSELAFDNNFKKGIRQAYLKGEAYFSVKKDPDNPFVVNTSDVNVKVLGTEFNLKAYPEEKEIAVTLVTGSLKVSGKTQQTIIKPNEKLIFNKENEHMGVLELSDLSPEVDWRNGRLVFNNQSLEELAPRLEHWFDVEIEFADEQVKQRRFTGTIDRESILEAIAFFGQSSFVGYRINGNVITLYSE